MYSILDAFGSRASHPNDKRLVAWLTLQLIAEAVEVVEAVEPIDRESSVRDIIGRFVSWRSRLEPGIMNGT